MTKREHIIKLRLELGERANDQQIADLVGCSRAHVSKTLLDTDLRVERPDSLAEELWNTLSGKERLRLWRAEALKTGDGVPRLRCHGCGEAKPATEEFFLRECRLHSSGLGEAFKQPCRSCRAAAAELRKATTPKQEAVCCDGCGRPSRVQGRSGLYACSDKSRRCARCAVRHDPAFREKLRVAARAAAARRRASRAGHDSAIAAAP